VGVVGWWAWQLLQGCPDATPLPPPPPPLVVVVRVVVCSTENLHNTAAILFARPPFCLHGRHFVYTAAILFTRPPFSLHGRHFVYTAAIFLTRKPHDDLKHVPLNFAVKKNLDRQKKAEWHRCVYSKLSFPIKQIFSKKRL
jgi:hypothetical protein